MTKLSLTDRQLWSSDTVPNKETTVSHEKNEFQRKKGDDDTSELTKNSFHSRPYPGEFSKLEIPLTKSKFQTCTTSELTKNNFQGRPYPGAFSKRPLSRGSLRRKPPPFGINKSVAYF